MEWEKSRRKKFNNDVFMCNCGFLGRQREKGPTFALLLRRNPSFQAAPGSGHAAWTLVAVRCGVATGREGGGTVIDPTMGR